jgi:hypothetical protein
VGFDFFEQKKLTAKERDAFNDARLKIINALAADLIFDLIELRSGDKDRFSAIRTEIVTYFSAADRYGAWRQWWRFFLGGRQRDPETVK